MVYNDSPTSGLSKGQAVSYDDYGKNNSKSDEDNDQDTNASTTQHDEDDEDSQQTPVSQEKQDAEQDKYQNVPEETSKHKKKGWSRRLKSKFHLKNRKTNNKKQPLIQELSPVQPYQHHPQAKAAPVITQEDAAVNQAFQVFADQSTIEGFSQVSPAENSKADVYLSTSSSGRDGSTLTSSHHPLNNKSDDPDPSSSNHQHKQVQVVASKDTQLELPGLKSHSHSTSGRKVEDPDAPLGSMSDVETTMHSKRSTDPEAPLGSMEAEDDTMRSASRQNDIREDDGDSTIVTALEMPTVQKSPSSHHTRTSIKEFYDLTEIQEEGLVLEPDGTISPRSYGDSVHIYPSFEVEDEAVSSDDEEDQTLGVDPSSNPAMLDQGDDMYRPDEDPTSMPTSPDSFTNAIRQSKMMKPQKVIHSPRKRFVEAEEEESRDEEDPHTKLSKRTNWLDTLQSDDDDDTRYELIQSPHKSYSIDERDAHVHDTPSFLEIDQAATEDVLERALNAFEKAKASLQEQQRQQEYEEDESTDMFDHTSRVDDSTVHASYHAEMEAQQAQHDDVSAEEETNGDVSTLPELPSQDYGDDEQSEGRTMMDLLAHDALDATHLARYLEAAPYLAEANLPEGRLPLHVACARGFPDRFSSSSVQSSQDSSGTLIDSLVQDAYERKQLIQTLGQYNMQACEIIDDAGDLPVHLLARCFMEWEAKWYQKVYESSSSQSADPPSAAAITKLYQTMSECINYLLSPISNIPSLCQLKGSIGNLLPLHLATIFTVRLETLEQILESHSHAAQIPCTLDGIQTFIPSNSLPLELHDRLSTDFPKWELKQQTEGSTIRRSDLLFAYNPNIEDPIYRQDASRIVRLEQIVRDEAEECFRDEEVDSGDQMPTIASRLWIWIATFDYDDSYADSVDRIVQGPSHVCVQKLCLVPDETGKAVLDAAPKEVRRVLLHRLSSLQDNEVAIPSSEFGTDPSLLYMNSPVLLDWSETFASQHQLYGQGHAAIMCRHLFGIDELDFPTSFILLPYQLIRDVDTGTLGLSSQEDVEKAMRFADCLMDLTQADAIVHLLQQKASRAEGGSLVGTTTKQGMEWKEMHRSIKKDIEALTSLFQESGTGYFYFLDEATGAPIVNASSSSSAGRGVYPIKVNDPATMVSKILPLLVSGMMLMRGTEKALSIIGSILMHSSIQNHPAPWKEVAKDLVAYLFSPQTEWTEGVVQELFPQREGLLEFLEVERTDKFNRNSKNSPHGTWAVELSLVRMLVEMNDHKSSYSGLQAVKAGGGRVLWTKTDDARSSKLLHYQIRTIDSLRAEAQDGLLSSDDDDDSKDASAASSKDTSSSKDSTTRLTGYEQLFGDLALTTTVYRNGSDADASDEDSENDDSVGGTQQPLTSIQDIQTQTKELMEELLMKPKRIMSTYATAAEPISLLDFDDDNSELYGLDDILQLRIQLDEQEVKLEFLSEKLSMLKVDEKDLLRQEEKISRLLQDCHDRQRLLLERHEARHGSSQKSGLQQARALVLRLCELEERVLCREIEVQQLNMEIKAFQIEASLEEEGVGMF